MKIILRSMFVVDKQDKQERLLDNFRLFQETGLEFDTPAYIAISKFIQDFVTAHGHVPDIATLRTHFSMAQDEAVSDRLEQLIGIMPKTGGDYRVLLQSKVDERRSFLWHEWLRDASTIASTGMEVQDGKEKRILRGPVQSAHFLVDKAHDIVAPTFNTRLSGEVLGDSERARKEYEAVKNDPLAGIGQFTGIDQIDSALGGARRHELWLHAAYTGGLKCVTGNTRIYDRATGRLRTVQDLHTSGDAPIVDALDESSWQMRPAQASKVVTNGIRPILKMTTHTGREIRVSGNHPFLLPRGWVDAGDVKDGDWVAAPKDLLGQSTTSYTDEEVALLGYLLGDGGIIRDISFTNKNPEVIKDFITNLEALGYRPAQKGVYSSFAGYSKGKRKGVPVIRVSYCPGRAYNKPWVSPLRILLEDLGLWGCGSARKHIPGKLWNITDDQVWLLLSCLWATGGRVGVDKSKGRKPKAVLAYGSCSPQLVSDIQLLLQRVGVPCTVSKVKVIYKGDPRPFWTVQITTTEGKRRFLEQTHITGKTDAAAEALSVVPAVKDTDWMPSELLQGLGDNVRVRTRTGSWYYAKLAKQRGKLARDTIRRFASAADDRRIIRQVDGNVLWERVVSCVPDGEEMTFDLSVPGPANFVANGFITHNSTFMLNWAYNQAVFMGHDVLIFSLEMPYEQCQRILNAIHSCHPKFRAVRHKMGLQRDPNTDLGLPYKSIRDGVLHEWHPNAEQFYFDYVLADFGGNIHNPDAADKTGQKFNSDYGKIFIEVADPDKDDFTIVDLRTKAETIHSRSPLAAIYVDHVGCMSSRRYRKSRTDEQNEVMRDLKKMAMGFNRGRGMAVIALFQINRDGYKSALKVKQAVGRAEYNLTHLAYANEAEKCVTHGTYTRTPDGITPLGAFLKHPKPVWSSTGWRRVLSVFDNGVRRIWETTTDRGAILRTTAPHRLKVVQDGHFGWRAVKDLCPSDFVASTFGDDEAWPEQGPRLPPLQFGPQESPTGRNGMGIRIEVPRETTEDLAYLLGQWDGDGKIHAQGLSWTGNRKETAVREAVRRAFIRAFKHQLPLAESPSRPGSYDLTKWSQPLKRWFEGLAGPRAMQVPDCILRGTKAHVQAYLRGLFDADGCVNSIGVVSLGMKGASEDFIRTIQMLLVCLGIDTVVGCSQGYLRQTGKSYSRVVLRVVTRRGRERFADLVGFTEPWKAQRLAEVVREGTEARGIGDTQVYPVPETFMRVYRLVHPPRAPRTRFGKSFYNLPSKVRTTGLVPRGALETLVRAVHDDGIENQDTMFLSKLLDIQVARVVFVEDTGQDEPVMDLEVEGDHEYQTGPILSHNSSDIVTATWIDDDLEKANRAQFQCLKARDDKKFEMFVARVEWPCRRLMTCYDVPMTPEENEKMGEELDKSLAAIADA